MSGVTLTVKARGEKDLQRKLARLGEGLKREAAEALVEIAKELLEAARERTPVETGWLKRSGHVKLTIYAGNVSARVIFDAPHARIVHEDMEAAHDNGEPKFLERALNELRPRLAAEMARRIDLRRAVR